MILKLKGLLVFFFLLLVGCGNHTQQSNNNEIPFILFNTSESLEGSHSVIDTATLFHGSNESVYPNFDDHTLARIYNNTYNDTILVVGDGATITVYSVSGAASQHLLFEGYDRASIDSLYFDENYIYVIASVIHNDTFEVLIRRYNHDLILVDEQTIDQTGFHYTIINGAIYFIRDNYDEQGDLYYTIQRKFFDNNNLDLLASFTTEDIINDFIINNEVILLVMEDIHTGESAIYQYNEDNTLSWLLGVSNKPIFILSDETINDYTSIVLFGEIDTDALQEGVYENINLRSGLITVSGSNVMVTPDICDGMIPTFASGRVFCPSLNNVRIMNAYDPNDYQIIELHDGLNVNKDSLYNYNIAFFVNNAN